MKGLNLTIIVGIGASVLGLPYLYYVFGPMEAEIALWGEVSLYTGIILILLSLAAGIIYTKVSKIILGLGCLIVALLQLPPIYLWIVFHGSKVTDSPSSSFTAHTVFAVPHIIMLTICIFMLHRLFSSRPSSALRN